MLSGQERTWTARSACHFILRGTGAKCVVYEWHFRRVMAFMINPAPGLSASCFGKQKMPYLLQVATDKMGHVWFSADRCKDRAEPSQSWLQQQEFGSGRCCVIWAWLSLPQSFCINVCLKFSKTMKSKNKIIVACIHRLRGCISEHAHQGP